MGERRVQPLEGLVSLPSPHLGKQLGPPRGRTYERRRDVPGDRRALLAIVAHGGFELAERHPVQGGDVILGAAVAFERLAVGGRGMDAFATGAALVRRGVPEPLLPEALRVRLSRPAGVEIFDRQAQTLRLGPPCGLLMRSGGNHLSERPPVTIPWGAGVPPAPPPSAVLRRERSDSPRTFKKPRRPKCCRNDTPKCGKR